MHGIVFHKRHFVKTNDPRTLPGIPGSGLATASLSPR
jgi:hypothetical protein